MAEAQLRFKITSQSLRRLDSYIGTEGSNRYLYASFDIDEDSNMPNPLLVVYVRYNDETYIVPKNEESGLYSIPSEVIQYPGFYLSCRVFSGNDDSISRYTEEVKIQIKGNGNILKRYMKADDQYSLEFLSTFYGQHVKNCENILALNEGLCYIQHQVSMLHDVVSDIGKIIQDSFEKLGKDLEFVKSLSYPIPIEPVDPVIPEGVEEDNKDAENPEEPNIEKYTVKISAIDGTVDSNYTKQEIEKGSNVSIVITPNENTVFKSITLNDVEYYEDTLPENISIVISEDNTLVLEILNVDKTLDIIITFREIEENNSTDNNSTVENGSGDGGYKTVN